MTTHSFVEASAVGFTSSPPANAHLSPSCLRAKGIELIALDPGHDDSDASRRSDAKVSGEGSSTRFLWPEIHEGNLNQVVAWLAYDMILKDPKLSDGERAELQSMIRFSRHPGERTFGEYELADGYSTSSQGTIDDTVTNRKARVNFMMKNHRPLKSDGTWASAKDVTSRTAFISVHANSSDYFGDGDVTWVIPPRGLTAGSPSRLFQSALVSGLADEFGEYYDPPSSDSNEVRSLKKALQPTVRPDEIIVAEHPVNLAMVSSELGNAQTRKLLLEGFVMNGKAGKLAHLELTRPESQLMKLKFRRKGKAVATSLVSSVYVAYAKSVVQGLSRWADCGN